MPSEEDDSKPPRLHNLKDLVESSTPQPVVGSWSSKTPIAIDLGSYQTRVGYATSETPELTILSQISKFRERKTNVPFTLVGNDIFLDPAGPHNARSLFDGPLISNWDALETLLDYSFSKLAIGSKDRVDSPIVMSEVVAAPKPQRMVLNELLFEGYGVPSVAFGIDALFAYRYNNLNNSKRRGIIVSAGHEATHIFPLLGEKMQPMPQVKRLNWGGHQAANYMSDLLSLKYPAFPAKISSFQATELVQDHCYVSMDYANELRGMLLREGLEERERAIQAPFVETATREEKTQEEIDRLAEKRREAGRRLKEQAAKNRREKMAQREADLEYYLNLQSLISVATSKKEVRQLLGEIKDEDALQKIISELDKAIRKARRDETGGDDEIEAPPEFPLLEVPDEDLDSDGIKAKRRQKLMKANYEARIKIKAEKIAEKKRIAEEEKADLDWRERDLEGWIADKKAKLDELLVKRRERRKLRNELNSRKSLASQMRMKNIAALASDSRKRKRGEVSEDDFGADDSDWSAYRNVNVDSDSEEVEEENKTIQSLQESLLQYDPTFTVEDESLNWRNSLVHMFLRGPRPFDPSNQAESHQFVLNVERIRVPEVEFQPSIAGVDQADIVEIVYDMLRNNSLDLANNIFVTGGFSKLRNFDARLEKELRPLLPVGTELNVTGAKDRQLDAWKGMANWILSGEGQQALVTKRQYEEEGSEYIKDHALSNVYV